MKTSLLEVFCVPQGFEYHPLHGAPVVFQNKKHVVVDNLTIHINYKSLNQNLKEGRAVAPAGEVEHHETVQYVLTQAGIVV